MNKYRDAFVVLKFDAAKRDCLPVAVCFTEIGRDNLITRAARALHEEHLQERANLFDRGKSTGEALAEDQFRKLFSWHAVPVTD